MWIFLRASDSVKKLWQVQLLNISMITSTYSTMSYKKTEYSFTFVVKDVIQVSLLHLYKKEHLLCQIQPVQGGCTMSIAHKKKEHIASFHALHQSAIGIDVHANLIVATYQNGDFEKGSLEAHTWSSGATKEELVKFAKWCKQYNPEVLIMESTGVYWQSLYEALENEGFTSSQIVIVNARDVKNKRGSKTDLADAIHLAEIARQGSYKASFVPSKNFRQLRCLWRSLHSLKNVRKKLLNILHKQLCQVGCRASSVFSDIRGKIATKILACLIRGERDEVLLKSIKEIVSTSRGRLKAKPQQIYEALQADMDSMVWFSIREHVEHIKYLDQQIAQSEQNIREKLSPYNHLIKLLTGIPAIKEITAMGLLCELGDDLSQFASIRKFCKWIGLAPGNNESAGKRYSGRTTPGNKYLKVLLVEAASGIGLMKKGFLHEVHQRFKERRGTKRANVAIAHKLCRIIFRVLKSLTEYQEQYKPLLKEHRYSKAVEAVAGLKDVGYICSDLEVKDGITGSVAVISGANKRKITAITNCC